MVGRPNPAAPPELPIETIGHVPADVGNDDLPEPDGNSPFPALTLPPAAAEGFNISGAELPELPDFDII